MCDCWGIWFLKTYTRYKPQCLPAIPNHLCHAEVSTPLETSLIKHRRPGPAPGTRSFEWVGNMCWETGFGNSRDVERTRIESWLALTFGCAMLLTFCQSPARDHVPCRLAPSLTKYNLIQWPSLSNKSWRCCWGHRQKSPRPVRSWGPLQTVKHLNEQCVVDVS